MFRTNFRNDGFTLVELMIVLAIIVILAAVAMPSFTEYRERSRVVTTAESIASLLLFTRSEAVKQSRNLIVDINDSNTGNDTDWCFALSDATTPCDCGITDTTNANFCQFGPAGLMTSKNLRAPVLTAPATTDIRIDSKDAAAAALGQLQFDNRRGDNLTPGTITVTGRFGYAMEVRHDDRGRVRLCSATIKADEYKC